ncbi:MAG: CPBP family intramembrane glutamic endopeptidase [Candidatus Kariarchaeaceae archaeon]
MSGSRKPLYVFGFFAITLFILEAALSIDFSANLLVVLLQLDLFLALVCWHIGVGLIAPRIRQDVWEDPTDDRYDDPSSEISDGFFSPFIRLLFPILLAAEVILLVNLMGDPTLGDMIMLALYIIGPFLLLYRKHWTMMFIATLWVWFPIEYGVIDDALGELTMSLIPLDAMIGIFALLWPLLTHGRHISWYHWDISKDDFMLVGKVSGVLTLAIVPLGILTNFITINPDNFLNPDIVVSSNNVVNIVVYIILIFYLIFLVQGLMEETLFRDVIFKHQYYWLKDRFDASGRWDLGHVMIGLAGILVISIPAWDDILNAAASILPFMGPVADRVGNMALPLGEYEGVAIPAIADTPLWIFYVLVAILLVGISLLIYSKHHTPMMAALLVSSIIFGFAHFQDFRYVFFASIAGFGYGYTYYKTKNLVPAAMVHMGVDAVWVLLLTY